MASWPFGQAIQPPDRWLWSETHGITRNILHKTSSRTPPYGGVRLALFRLSAAAAHQPTVTPTYGAATFTAPPPTVTYGAVTTGVVTTGATYVFEYTTGEAATTGVE